MAEVVHFGCKLTGSGRAVNPPRAGRVFHTSEGNRCRRPFRVFRQRCCLNRIYLARAAEQQTQIR